MNYENLKNMQKIQEYVTNMRPAFNKRAVFSDETESYRMPFEPKTGDTVKIRIRTKRGNVDMVCLVSGQEKKKMNQFFMILNQLILMLVIQKIKQLSHDLIHHFFQNYYVEHLPYKRE